MNVVREGKNRPIKVWADDVEDGAMEQAKHLAALPFAFRHIALMPDVHRGYGMPIGGVMATQGVIVPNAVGVDIGCGMRAVPLNVLAEDVTRDDLERWVARVKDVIPMGFDSRSEPIRDMPEIEDYGLYVVERRKEKAAKQIGTLGGGNHFVEFQRARGDGRVWLMIHSGSRNLGKQVADYYNRVAKERNAMWYSAIDPKWDLAFLPLNDKTTEPMGGWYVAEMNYCVEYAKLNRATMMDEALDAIDGLTATDEPLDVAHNYAAQEHHFGKNVWVHRKGATRARKDELGIIPGSQGTCSYIVRGLGNRESFFSCSHGAGRRMGRREAKRTLDLAAEIEAMDAAGIVHGMRGVDDLDEAASAYKDIDVVMAQQADLVEIVERLEPLAVIKG